MYCGVIIIISFVSNQQLQHFNLQLKNNHSDIWIFHHHHPRSSPCFLSRSSEKGFTSEFVCSSSSSFLLHFHFSLSSSNCLCSCFRCCCCCQLANIANPLEILLVDDRWSAKARRPQLCGGTCLASLSFSIDDRLIALLLYFVVIYLLRVGTPNRIHCSTYILLYIFTSFCFCLR